MLSSTHLKKEGKKTLKEDMGLSVIGQLYQGKINSGHYTKYLCRRSNKLVTSFS
jgi:hypothetical protein